VKGGRTGAAAAACLSPAAALLCFLDLKKSASLCRLPFFSSAGAPWPAAAALFRRLRSGMLGLEGVGGRHDACRREMFVEGALAASPNCPAAGLVNAPGEIDQTGQPSLTPGHAVGGRIGPCRASRLSSTHAHDGLSRASHARPRHAPFRSCSVRAPSRLLSRVLACPLDVHRGAFVSPVPGIRAGELAVRPRRKRDDAAPVLEAEQDSGSQKPRSPAPSQISRLSIRPGSSAMSAGPHPAAHPQECNHACHLHARPLTPCTTYDLLSLQC
jgi:hypothetical protein